MEKSNSSSHEKECKDTYEKETKNWCGSLQDFEKEACVSGLYFNMENCILYK